MILLITAASQQ